MRFNSVRFRSMIALAVAISGIGMAASSSVLADYEAGLRAYASEDYDAARSAWSESGMEQEPKALFALGVMYMRGVGVEEATAIGVEYYLKSAELGFPSAQYNLGLAYFAGRGVEQNVELARDWWRKASDLGHPVAQYNLGAILWSGNGVDQDQAGAMHWFRTAKANGSRDASDFLLTLFAPMYRELNAESLAAAQDSRVRSGSSSTIPLVDEFGTYKLGLQAMQAAKYGQANKYWVALAEGGHIDSQYQLGRMAELGQGVSKDFDVALQWYEKAAQKGQGDAQYRLGMYYMNESPEPNEALGFYWIQSAADNNSAEAAKYIKSL